MKCILFPKSAYGKATAENIDCHLQRVAHAPLPTVSSLKIAVGKRVAAGNSLNIMKDTWC